MFLVNQSIAAKLAAVLTVSALHVGLCDLVRVFVQRVPGACRSVTGRIRRFA
jgi:hypothetical protein